MSSFSSLQDGVTFAQISHSFSMKELQSINVIRYEIKTINRKNNSNTLIHVRMEMIASFLARRENFSAASGSVDVSALTELIRA